MRIKLSRMGWNNVLIFASMFMILLFNYSHNMMTGGGKQGESQVLVANNTIIQNIDFNGVKLERLGASWRTVSTLQQEVQINAPLIIETWTQQPFNTLSHAPVILDTAKVFLVVVWAAGEPNGWIYEFVVDEVNQTSFVKSHQAQTWFEIDFDSMPHLVPAVLLEL